MSASGYAPGRNIARLHKPVGRPRFVVPQEARSSTQSVDAQCKLQCIECGLQLEYADVGDPESPNPCPNCEARAWADLAEGGVVEALIEQDNERWDTRHGRRNAVAKVVGVMVGGLLAALSMRNDGSIIFFPIVLMAVAVILRTASREYAAGRRPDRPVSWSYYGPAGAAVGMPYSGEASAAETDSAMLIAPLSGRPCLAYELGVRHDSKVEGAPWTWTLLEQRALPMSVGGQPLNPRVHLSPARAIAKLPLDEAAKGELRRRGLDPERPGYTIYESVIESGAQVTVTAHEQCTVVGMAIAG